MHTMMLTLTLFAAQPTIEELRQMPQVAAVEARGVANPSHRITHILNWHFVTHENFALEADAEDYEAFLKDVDAVQVEQMAFLQQLKVRKVFYEGLTTKNHADYVDRAAMLKTLGKPMGEGGIDLLLAEFIREDTLQLGAAGRLLILGQIDDVSPGDDHDAMERADPVKSGKLVFDEMANEDRENAVVRLLLRDKESVLIMGGGHDLTNRLPAGVEYRRVQLKAYVAARNKGMMKDDGTSKRSQTVD